MENYGKVEKNKEREKPVKGVLSDNGKKCKSCERKRRLKVEISLILKEGFY